MTQRVLTPAVVLGLGTARPANVMTQDEATFLAQEICARNEDERRLVKVLYRKAGVKERSTVVPHETALRYLTPQVAAVGANAAGFAGDELAEAEPPLHYGPTTQERMEFYRTHAPGLALEAAGAALDDAALAPDAITHVVVVTCTGFYSPGIDAALIEQLGLPRTTERIQVGFMGCHGAINGLRAATALVAADPGRRVLLCCVELCSLHYCFQWDPLRAVGNAVFADGAAAMVLGPPGDREARLRPAACGSYLIPDSADAMTWTIGDHGFEMILSPRVPDLIGEHLRPFMESWLAKHGLAIDKVGGWAVHPGGPRVLSAVEDALGLDRTATAVSREVLATCGNMSSPTVLFILDRMRRLDMPRPYVALGFGPGLAAEAALFT
jgi:predicted naringenin-chalcone synthase